MSALLAMDASGIEGIFPCWRQDYRALMLANAMAVNSRVAVCVDPIDDNHTAVRIGAAVRE